MSSQSRVGSYDGDAASLFLRRRESSQSDDSGAGGMRGTIGSSGDASGRRYTNRNRARRAASALELEFDRSVQRMNSSLDEESSVPYEADGGGGRGVGGGEGGGALSRSASYG